MKMKRLTLALGCALSLFLPAHATQTVGRGATLRTPDTATAATAAPSVGELLLPRTSGLRQAPHADDRSAIRHAESPLQAAGKETRLYGSLIYSADWSPDSRPYGIYSMPLSSPDDIETVKLSGSLNANAGGVYCEGKFCFVNYFESFGAITAYYYIYDATTWERISSNRVPNTSIATDLTYDPVSRTIYGCFLNSTNNGYVFGSMEASTGAVTAISNLNAPFFFVAASPTGEVFGVQNDGFLYKIDKYNGSWKAIGNTGVIPKNSQSATFDKKTGKLYWAACTDQTSGLYEVDTTTGRATLIERFSVIREFGGLYTPDPEASDMAPDAVTDLKVEYITSTASDLNVSFTMPSTTYNGSPLTGEVDYTVIIDDVDQYIESAQAGEEVSFTLHNTKSGEVSVGIATGNDNGRGPTRTVKLWVGKDSPCAVTDITYSVTDGNVVNLSWTAPTEGIHGGYVNPDKLTYKIVRRPDNKVVADGISGTTFSDNTGVSKLSYFYYDITPYCDGLTGETASSGKVVAGNAMTTPYLEQFNTPGDFELFTVIDANEDGRTWEYDYKPRAYCSYSTVNQMDDWLLTPPIMLSNDRLYKLSFSVYASDFTELFNVCIGDGASVESMTTELVPATAVSGMTPRTITATIRVSESKPYYIGFHKTSPADRSSLYLDDISVVDDALIEAPDAPSDLTVVPADMGELKATISFKAPEKTIGGDPLDNISSIYLYRNDQIIRNFKTSEITPGGILTYVDQEALQGFNTYKAIARNSAGNGLETSVQAFIGIDQPGLPQNVRVVEVQGHAHITWEAPVTGAHGGYFDPDNLSYLIGSPTPAGDDMDVIVSDYKGYSIDVTVQLEGVQQKALTFYVFAKSTGGISSGQFSNNIVMGTPYDLPFYESFPDGYPTQAWYPEVTATGYWQSGEYGMMPTTDAQDLDGGLLSFYPDNTGDEGFVYTGKLSTLNSANPTFEYYYYHKRGSQDRFEVKVTNNGADWKVAETVSYSDTDSGNGWVHRSVPLGQFAGTGFIQVGIHVYSVDGITAFHFDNFAIRQVYEQDLEAVNIFAPNRLGTGNSGAVSVQVANRGAKTSGDYTVELYRNDTKTATLDGTGLEPGQVRTFSFQQTADRTFGDRVEYYAVVNYAADMFNDNNNTRNITVEITQPTLPAVNDLTAEADGNKATLRWSTPAYNSISDDIESYSPFAISGFGDWTTIDVDGSETAALQGYTWPYAYSPQAWIVFDPVALNVATEDDGSPSMFATHSGNQMLISFTASNGKNDDWLISPLLNGKAQTVSFYIKSATNYYGLEEYEFLTSNSSALDINTFVSVSEDHSVPTEWTKVEFELEEGTRYFAIRNIGQMKYALCIDDVTCSPASLSAIELEGFNVYCNNKKLTDTPVTDNTYLYEGIEENGSYVFTVTAVYNEGESEHSNTAVIGKTGVDAPGCQVLEVRGERGGIVILHGEGEDFAAFAADGRTVANGTLHGYETRIPVTTGVYIIVVSGKAHKVLVK